VPARFRPHALPGQAWVLGPYAALSAPRSARLSSEALDFMRAIGVGEDALRFPGEGGAEFRADPCVGARRSCWTVSEENPCHTVVPPGGLGRGEPWRSVGGLGRRRPCRCWRATALVTTRASEPSGSPVRSAAAREPVQNARPSFGCTQKLSIRSKNSKNDFLVSVIFSKRLRKKPVQLRILGFPSWCVGARS
jgi:hypothetical protein